MFARVFCRAEGCEVMTGTAKYPPGSRIAHTRVGFCDQHKHHAPATLITNIAERRKAELTLNALELVGVVRRRFGLSKKVLFGM